MCTCPSVLMYEYFVCATPPTLIQGLWGNLWCVACIAHISRAAIVQYCRTYLKFTRLGFWGAQIVYCLYTASVMLIWSVSVIVVVFFCTMLFKLMLLFLFFVQKIMKTQDKTGQYFQTKRPSQLVSEPINKVGK